jgi:hypothetical protein
MNTDLSAVPAKPGLYVVSVDCDDAPIDTDPRRPNCLRISRRNCKFGRAKNLRARYKNYLGVFEGYPVTFKVIAVLSDINGAESACMKRLADFRSLGTTGRRHEWLLGISPTEVEEIACDVLVEGGFVRTFEPPAIRNFEDAIATRLLNDHFTTAAALIAAMLRNLPDHVRTQTLDAVRNGTGKVELRTRAETTETELVLVPTNGSEPLWLARTPAYF